jgi:hypothetical protein
MKATLLPDHIPRNNYELMVVGGPPLHFTKVGGLDEELEAVDLPNRTKASGGTTKSLEFTVEHPLHHAVENDFLESWWAACQNRDPGYKKPAVLVLQSISRLRTKTFNLLELFIVKRKTPDLEMANDGELATIEWTFCVERILDSKAGAGAGAAGVGPQSKLWTLTDLDHNEDVVGQFIPQRVTKTVSAQIAHASSVNWRQPILQWIGGELETVTFDAKLWAQDNRDTSVEARLERLEALVKRQDDLKRPPVCHFAWGSVSTLGVDCLVRSIGGVVYDEIQDDGTLLGVSLSVTLERYEPPELKVTDPSVPEKFTRVRRARRGDTYEKIALAEYGDPLLGVLLRQRNPRIPGMGLADLRSGDGVHVFPEDHLVTLPIEPQFHAFQRGPGHEAAGWTSPARRSRARGGG